ncbi:hypothetical protein [Paenibacillus sp. NEAU-GSW1]|uniref:hypothetical protein n=1 Tax=Paenibacillus sp. NEAU-GSW1 TaxID=2682486 RepID=UPI0012E11567|nr:hypothetical protein [Paenibacillus sp. NEAU-GSW1]MUT67097.1 hypothetical protein [Paenibacillus sp. NEAU-GSW1]
MKRFLFMLFCLVILTSCSKDDRSEVEDVFYQYPGTVATLVDQHNKEIIDGLKLKVTYTLGLENFMPTAAAFENYLSSYPKQDDEKRRLHIELTEKTQIYEKRGDRITKVSPAVLEAGTDVQLWLRVYPEYTTFIEAVQIVVNRD